MQSRILVALVALTAVSAGASSARGDAIAPPSVPSKLGSADVILAGQVVALEDQDVTATTNPAAKVKVSYRIAVVQVTEMLKGDAKQKLVRVGFVVTQPLPPGAGPVGYNIPLTVGKNGLFFLKKHHEGSFHVLPMFGTFVSSEFKPQYDQELALTRKTLKVVQNPVASLQAKDSAERLEAAIVLIDVYRTPPFNSPAQQEMINAEESKLILKALLDANWNLDPGKTNLAQTPNLSFIKLGLGSKDGWQQPTGVGVFAPQYAAAARAWLEKNWQTYRIQKIVVAGAASK
jgi:hypothetical protein